VRGALPTALVLALALGYGGCAAGDAEPTPDADADADAPNDPPQAGDIELPPVHGGPAEGDDDPPPDDDDPPPNDDDPPPDDDDPPPNDDDPVERPERPRPTDAECAPLTACGLECANLDADPQNCGFCGRTCVIPNATATCVAGECAVEACDAGFFDDDGDAENGCELESVCTPGGTCETACGTEGAQVCEGGRLTCAPPAEACNALDDDCNGACDDGAAGCRVPVHRSSGNGHLYTTDLGQAQAGSFRLETEAYFHLYTQQVAGMRPVFLCLKPNNKFFLSNDTACEIMRGPVRELGFWSPRPLCDSTPLYRLYHPESGNHFFTVSDPERQNAVDNLGYIDEGVAGHVWRGP
jgi:hypothetical protein